MMAQRLEEKFMAFKMKTAAAFLAALLITSGCTVQKGSVTKSVNAPESSKNKQYAIDNIVKGFLPEGSKLLPPENPQGASPIQMEDVDGDNIPEVIAIYRMNTSSEKNRVLLLKQKNESWSQVTELSSLNDSSIGLDWAGFHKLDNGNSKFLVLGWHGSSKNQLDIYRWNKDGITKVFTRQYDKLEIDDFSDKNNKKDDIYEFALWTKDIGEGYVVDLYRFNGTNLVKDENLYANYYQKVVDYYEQKIKQNPSTAYYYYYLAYAENIENDYINASAAIKKGMSLQCDEKLKERFNSLKSEIDTK